MRSKMVCVFVGLCAVMTMIMGCAKGNPVSITSTESHDFALMAKLAAATDTIGVDTGIVNDNFIFVPIDKNGKKESVQSCTYDFGDGSSVVVTVGLLSATHRFTAAGKFNVVLHVLMKNGTIQDCGMVVFVINQSVANTTPSKDSVFKWISTTPVGTNTNVFSVVFGTLVVVVTPKSGTVNPFSIGYDDWAAPILLNSQPKSANGRLILVTKTLTGGSFYDVGFGKCWNGSNGNSIWLTPSEQAGNRYYNPTKKIMSFFLGYNGTPYRLDSIPADSGKINVVTPTDSTKPGVYGDIGAKWRVRFQDLIHSNVAGGKDSVIVYCSLHGLEACSTSTPTMTTDIASKPVINLIRPAGKLYAYTILAADEIPNSDGLTWNYSWGTCVQTDNSGSSFWSFMVNGTVVAFQARWSYPPLGLQKTAAGGSGDHLISVK